MTTINTHTLFKELVATGLPENTSEFKTEMAELKTELKSDMATKTDLLRFESIFIKEISNLKFDILKWMIPLFLTLFAMITGLFMSILFKLFL